MSFDPVAHDALGFKPWSDMVKQQGQDAAFVQRYTDKANS
jgi:hypothetical protein